AEFELIHVDDPYGHSSASDLSMFRRPLPSTNLAFLSAVMWDGRETFTGETIHFDLSDQANGATTGHAQGDPLTDDQPESIVAYAARPTKTAAGPPPRRRRGRGPGGAGAQVLQHRKHPLVGPPNDAPPAPPGGVPPPRRVAPPDRPPPRARRGGRGVFHPPPH